MTEHSFGNTSDVIDLGSGHFMRPIHKLERTTEPIGSSIKVRASSPVEGFMLWHECQSEADSSWRCVYPDDPEVHECPICGDRGHVVNAAWAKA